jgi:hypothetical protein
LIVWIPSGVSVVSMTYVGILALSFGFDGAHATCTR